jgi:aspartate/methionine/tyrosine aminotransferase
MSAKFVPNPNFERELKTMVDKEMRPAIEAAITSVSERMSGGSEPEIRAAIIEEARRRGVKYQPSDEIVSTIARGESISAD